MWPGPESKSLPTVLGALGSPSPWLVLAGRMGWFCWVSGAGSRVYIAGGLLRWQEQHKRGPRGDFFPSLFYIMTVGEVWVIVCFLLDSPDLSNG